MLSKYHISYKTRIQVAIVAAVIFTLLIIASITYLSISYQYRSQQVEAILKRVNQIADVIEQQMLQNDKFEYNEQILKAFSSINAIDLNLFSPNGDLLVTTQSKIDNNGLFADKIDAMAYIYLNKYQRSEYVNKEQIGSKEYLSVYRPIRNDRNQILAYLNLLHFSYERDYDNRIGQFLNVLLNVYALVFVSVGFFAVFIANKITYPLKMLQKSLGDIKIGRKNEPILWDRDDEIGRLIKEYNKMIVSLEDGAQKFARSERETAWKEMAKQVAHEIKNPLTPLKLGIQMLEKSWKEKDANFDQKFERFSRLFIEQIESLSNIASEFSNFAKMPDTTLENVNILEIIEQSIDGFRSKNRVAITLKDDANSNHLVKADKNQLLRLLNNLINNAIEAIPDFREGKIDIVVEQKSGAIQVVVGDNGKGISEDQKQRIFNPNFTTKSSGTGLGLAFVRQATENMAGTVRFETEINRGTTFYITIPLADI